MNKPIVLRSIQRNSNSLNGTGFQATASFEWPVVSHGRCKSTNKLRNWFCYITWQNILQSHIHSFPQNTVFNKSFFLPTWSDDVKCLQQYGNRIDVGNIY